MREKTDLVKVASTYEKKSKKKPKNPYSSSVVNTFKYLNLHYFTEIQFRGF